MRRTVDFWIVFFLVMSLALRSRTTAVAASFGLILIVLRPWDEVMSQSRWLAPLRACGRRCYSIYLIHLLVCTIGAQWMTSLGVVGFWPRALVLVPIVALVSVAVSWVFFGAVEAWFLNAPPDLLRHPRPLAGESELAPPGPGLELETAIKAGTAVQSESPTR
jgi:peptidoglycan/LPS O-acetylase OafA/YrhL